MPTSFNVLKCAEKAVFDFYVVSEVSEALNLLAFDF